MTTRHQSLWGDTAGRHGQGLWQFRDSAVLPDEALLAATSALSPLVLAKQLAQFTYYYRQLQLYLLIGIHILQKLEPAANRYSKLFSINQHNLCWFSWCLFPTSPQSRTSSLCGHGGAHVEQPQQLQGQLGVGMNFACPHGLSTSYSNSTSIFFSTPGSCEALLIYHLKSVFIQHSKHDCKWFIVVILLDYFNFRSTAFLLFIFPGNTHCFSSL